MYELVQTALQMPIPFNMLIVLGSLGIGLAALTMIATEVRKVATRRLELDFKRDLISQGMSAEEVERVLKADRK